jgi:hypothetical protein
LCAVTAVTASSSISSTPLYTVRMEQASSDMNFLPTAVNEFIYMAEHGYAVNYNVPEYCKGVIPFKPPTEIATCPYTCDDDTCEQTCPNTCWNTCPNTCWSTCPVTCEPTCLQYTCENSCHAEPSCKIVCDP